MAQRVLYPDHIEPLVQFVEETTPERIVAATHDKLTAGTPVKDMLLASALAVVRSSDLPPGHHGGPLHPLAGLHAVRNISARLPGEYAKLPVIQNVAVANKHIHSPAMGPFILADARPVSENDDVDATIKAFRTAVSRGVYNACDHYFLYLLERRSPMQMLELLLEVGIAKNQLDDHYFLFPVFTWRALEYFGWEYAKYIGRAPVRYVTRPTAPATLADVDELIRKHELLERDLRAQTGEDETAAITALADEIGRCNDLNEIPEMLAQALAGGVSLEGVGEGLSVGGSTLFLRSQTGNPMDVHINTGANTRRYLLRQPELSRRIKLQALLVWHTGPEVRMVQRMLARDLQPEPERVASLPFRTQDELIDEIESFIGRLPVGERLPAANLATWRSTDEVKQVAALAQQYADRGYAPEALITAMGKIACRDNFTEMHALKHHQATYEEFYATPPVAALAPPGGGRAGRGDLARPDPGRLRSCGRGDALLGARVMAIVGAGRYRYQLVEHWGRLPAGQTFGNVSAVATDSLDRVYVFQRKDPPVLVFDREGGYLGGWGIGAFANPHGIYIGNDVVYLTDRDDSVCLTYTLDGKPLQILGKRGAHSDTGCERPGELVPRSAGPFNYPTEMVPAPSGDLYITDGYRNARVHRFSPAGELIASWGEPGKTEPNQFHLPHSLIADRDGAIYVCDRENNRIQVFSADGDFQTMWTDLRRPLDISMDRDGLFCISEGGVSGLSPRISLMDKRGAVVARWDSLSAHGSWVDAHGDIYLALGSRERLDKYVRQ